MTEITEDDDRDDSRAAPAQATVHHSWWPGWIWGVPLAAAGISVWLLVRSFTRGGTDITITFSDSHRIDPSSTTVEYRGVTVGHVTGVSLAKDGKTVDVTAKMNEGVTRFLTADTVFWLRGANPSLSDLSSLGAVLSGPTIVMDPGGGKATRQFHGTSREPAVPVDSGAPVLFKASFDGAVGDLPEGDVVKLRGFAVGEVKSIGFSCDATTGAIKTPVTLALYPSQFHIEGAEDTKSATALETTMEHLVAHGLRASLDRDPPFIGGHRVALEVVPRAPPAKLLRSDGVSEIPTTRGDDVQSLLTDVGQLPLAQIGRNLRDLTRHLDQIASSPKLSESIAQLDASLTELHRTLRSVAPRVETLVDTLRDAAQQLDSVAAAADKTIGGPATQVGLSDTLREVRDAARSIRSLAEYLERHPESFITGKPK
jgi:paraquat-inducible protein B